MHIVTLCYKWPNSYLRLQCYVMPCPQLQPVSDRTIHSVVVPVQEHTVFQGTIWPFQATFGNAPIKFHYGSMETYRTQFLCIMGQCYGLQAKGRIVCVRAGYTSLESILPDFNFIFRKCHYYGLLVILTSTNNFNLPFSLFKVRLRPLVPSFRPVPWDTRIIPHTREKSNKYIFLWISVSHTIYSVWG